jgi:HK97 gp10 family phage protein
MVKGLDVLHRRLVAITPKIEAAVRPVMETYARQIVAQMQAVAPEDSGDLKKSIKWKWGDPPKGAVAIASFSGSDDSSDTGLRISIYADGNVAFYAHFIEFGTAPHALAQNASVARGKRQDQGGQHPGTAAQPFFFPIWRANRKRVKAGISRAVRKVWSES